MKALARFPSPAGERSQRGRPVLAATALTAGCLVAVGLVGTLSLRHFGGVPFSVPSWPWYYSWPSYLFWQPTLDAGAALVALPVALAAAATLVALARAEGLSRRLRLVGSLVALAALVLAVAALAGGPAAWSAPLAFVGEYPGAAGQVGPVPAFLGEFPARVPGWTRPPWPPWPPAAWGCWWWPAWPATSSARSGSGSPSCAGPWPRSRSCTWPPRPTPCGRRCWPGPPWPPTGACSAARSAGRWPAGGCCGWPPCSASRPPWSCPSWPSGPWPSGRRPAGAGCCAGRPPPRRWCWGWPGCCGRPPATTWSRPWLPWTTSGATPPGPGSGCGGCGSSATWSPSPPSSASPWPPPWPCGWSRWSGSGPGARSRRRSAPPWSPPPAGATPGARSSGCGSSWSRSRWWWRPASCCAGGPACPWWPASCLARPWPSSCCSTPAGSRSTADQLGHGGPEHLGVGVDVVGGGGRAHQGHVVERGQQDAPVVQVQVQVVVELVVAGGGRLAAVDRGRAAEPVLGPGPQLHHRPEHLADVEDSLDAVAEACAQPDHVLEGLVGEDVLQGGPHGRHRQGVAGQGAADPAGVDQVGVAPDRDPVGDLGREAVGAGWDPAGDGLAHRDQVRLQPPGQGAAAGPGRQGVGLVVDQQGAVAAGQLAHALQVAGGGQDDADVGQGRLHEHAGHVAGGQLAVQGVQVVELDHPGGGGRVDRGADVALAGRRPVAAQGDQALVDGAVVAVVEHQDLGPAGDQAGQPDGPAVGVGGGQAEAPAGHPEAAGQLGPDPGRVGGGQHGRGPAGLGVAAPHGRHRGLGRVPGHGRGVAQAQVDVAVAVQVGHGAPSGLGQVHREPPGRLVHPGHGDVAEQVGPVPVGGLAARMALGVGLAFAPQQGGQSFAVHWHGRPFPRMATHTIPRPDPCGGS